MSVAHYYRPTPPQQPKVLRVAPIASSRFGLSGLCSRDGSTRGDHRARKPRALLHTPARTRNARLMRPAREGESAPPCIDAAAHALSRFGFAPLATTRRLL
jgi:hypothetical protein